MGTVHDRLDEKLTRFISSQPVFFVATAPQSGGHVNVSPKGYGDTFAVLNDRTVAYLDLDGSGVETVSHIRDNGRITIMFCAFSGRPNIVRLYGSGRVVLPADPAFGELIGSFGSHPGVRSIVIVDIERVADSCGFAVPFMSYDKDRTKLDDWARKTDVQKRRRYRAKHNRESIDGLPGLSPDETDPVATSS